MLWFKYSKSVSAYSTHWITFNNKSLYVLDLQIKLMYKFLECHSFESNFIYIYIEFNPIWTPFDPLDIRRTFPSFNLSINKNVKVISQFVRSKPIWLHVNCFSIVYLYKVSKIKPMKSTLSHDFWV